MDIVEYLDKQKINWDNYEISATHTRDLLSEISANLENIVRLIDNLNSLEGLQQKCETHQLLDYLVLYDNPGNGIRLRMHMSTSDHLQRPHDHRFDFSTKVLCGSYEHIWYFPIPDFYQQSDINTAKNYQDKNNPDPHFELFGNEFKPMFIRREVKDSCYSISNEIVHSVDMVKDTVSIIIRSPARKQRSFIYDWEMKKLWWRFGSENETKKRRQQKIMTAEHRYRFIENVQRLNII
jgi:hypothetical protein